MTKKTLLTIVWMSFVLTSHAIGKQWTVADGLPTGEVHQIVELPNGQILVNCEGVFCLSNGRGFQTIPCDYSRCYHLPHYKNGYSQRWQGDSLLWLCDFYRIYLFDARTRSFRYDIENRLNDELFESCQPSPLTITDRQGGQWTATMAGGISYDPPKRQLAEQLMNNHPLIDKARSTIDSQRRIWRCKINGLECETDGKTAYYHINNVKGLPYNKTTFITELPDRRFLLCDSLCLLGYFYPDVEANPVSAQYVLLNDRLTMLSQYRHFVGACVIDSLWTAVYSQNGAFLLNIKADTLAPLPATKNIEHYSDKYNCMALDRKNRLWVGTQNGLFKIQELTDLGTEGRKSSCSRVEGLANNCIRSLLVDSAGNVWAGTSCGLSRITPTVVNYGPEDSISAAPMMERAATLTDDGRLVFAFTPARAICFRPEWLNINQKAQPVVITAMSVDGKTLSLEELTQNLSFTYNQNYLTFQFSALNYATPTHTRYRYRLAGLEKDWQPYADLGGSLGTVEYRALSPGTYTFEVQTTIDDGEWGPATQITITIRPPWWLTWWAKLAYCLIGLMILTGLMGYYIKRKREKLERENDSRVNHLFELREEARHQFAEATNVDPQKIGVNNEEQELTERMLKAIETHMTDAEYGVDQLAQDVFMSRSALYQKLRNMLGISPADFIRNVRMKRAAQLLSETDLPIGEVADRVGYNTHKAFATNFKKMFGVLPSEYRCPKAINSKDEESAGIV